MLLESIVIEHDNQNDYPYNLELFSKEIVLDINNPVTVFVGENGCGKSSLLKLLQAKLGLLEIKLPKVTATNRINARNVSIKPRLHKLNGFFFESLAFIKYIEYIQNEITESMKEIARIDEEYKGKSAYSRSMAKSPYTRTISELKGMYSGDLSKSSHGEAYLDFFASRIRDNQIYLLDEPETPLSVQNQLTLMAMIIEATKRGCQFILATHSPILCAIPGAGIYEIDKNDFIKKTFEDIESISLLKQFLNNKDQFLRHFDTKE